MTRDSWLDLLDLIQEKFGIDRKETVPVEQTSEDQEIPGSIERIYFHNGSQNFRLDFTTRPVVLDKKAHFRRSAGNVTRVEYIYSEDEVTHKLVGYTEQNGEFKEIGADIQSLL